MNGLFRVGRAQTEFVWKLVDLYGRRTDRRNSAFMGGCTLCLSDWKCDGYFESRRARPVCNVRSHWHPLYDPIIKALLVQAHDAVIHVETHKDYL
jgi:hypothetical protein